VASRLLDHVLVRLLLYYGGFFAAVLAIGALFPKLIEALARERERHAMVDGDVGGFSVSGAEGLTNVLPDSGELVVVVGVSMLGSLALAIPVAWVYGWTSRKSTYQKSFAQSLLVFPLAVALVVFLVKGSIALAFGLAGIVAAVRFRSQLPETRDAVFLVLVIGIGLAAGVQLIPVAILASVIFNFAMVTITLFDFGASPRRMDGLMLRPRRNKQEDREREKPSVE
jgi:hypothetical protein